MHSLIKIAKNDEIFDIFAPHRTAILTSLHRTAPHRKLKKFSRTAPHRTASSPKNCAPHRTAVKIYCTAPHRGAVRTALQTSLLTGHLKKTTSDIVA